MGKEEKQITKMKNPRFFNPAFVSWAETRRHRPSGEGSTVVVRLHAPCRGISPILSNEREENKERRHK